MRTTIRLDDALLAEAKAEAARSGRTLTQLIEDAVRASLARRSASPDREVPPIPTFKGRGLQRGIDLDSSASLLDLMDERAAP